MLDQSQSASRPRRRLLRFSMRGLIVLVLVIGGGMGWLVRAVHIQHAAAAAISGIGGSVMYNWEWNNGRSYSGATPWVPKWLSDRVGVDYFGHITSVWLCAVSMETDAALAPVLRLTQLQRLSVTGSSVTDTGLARLRVMTTLSRLDDLLPSHLNDLHTRHAVFANNARSSSSRAATSLSIPTGFSLNNAARKTHAARYEPARVGWLLSRSCRTG